MKKILSFLAAGALALGLIGCSGDLHNVPLEDTTILKAACIVGINGNWDNEGKSNNKLTKIDDTYYKYTFTSESATQEFSILETAGPWNETKRWCGNHKKAAAGDPETVAIKPDDDFKVMVYSAEADPTHIQISGLEINSEYMITIKIVDSSKKDISCKIELTKAGEKPSAYSWKDLTLKGGWEDSWGDTVTLTDAATQEYTFTAATASGKEFGIFGKKSNVWNVEDLELGTRTEMTFVDGAGPNSTMAEDWVVGATYKFKLELTDNSVDAPKAYITVTKE